MSVAGTRALNLRPATASEVARAIDVFARARWTPVTEDEDSERVEAGNREVRYVEAERSRVRRAAADAPIEADAFCDWFEALDELGPGQSEPLFPWLAAEATHQQLLWVMRQEAAADDTSGTTLLDVSELVPEVVAAAHLLGALGRHRRYAHHALGAVAAIQLTAPGRAAQVMAGLARLGRPPESGVSIRSETRWNRAAIRTLVASDPRVARSIAEGALMRLEAGARCFDRYRSDLWGATV
ncbi:MAG TPA: iron-containing redox enzyme family protein [Polyangiaceae bacterium]|nr:iron-containing redox enzyme family protein [Polyangiaceae bacterium]